MATADHPFRVSVNDAIAGERVGLHDTAMNAFIDSICDEMEVFFCSLLSEPIPMPSVDSLFFTCWTEVTDGRTQRGALLSWLTSRIGYSVWFRSDIPVVYNCFTTTGHRRRLIQTRDTCVAAMRNDQWVWMIMQCDNQLTSIQTCCDSSK